jgi:FKBP-type peptidyl-prolyl cis-trans isomerase
MMKRCRTKIDKNIGKVKKLCLLVMLSYCNVNVFAQYITLTNQIQYRICQEGKLSNKVTAGCFVYLHITGATQKSESLFNERYWLKIDDDPRQNSLHNALRKLKQNDSAEFLLPYKLILESLVNLPRIKNLQSKDKITLRVRVVRITKSDIAFDKGYDEFCRQQDQQAQRFIRYYLKNNAAFEKQKSGIYAKTLQNGTGKRMEKSGNVMMLHYTGRFLNGTTFDKTPQNSAFRYVRGVQFQMIQGIAMTLSTMSEGEKVQLLIPAKLAFGSRGLADIVPPFSPVVYEVEMLRVER